MNCVQHISGAAPPVFSTAQGGMLPLPAPPRRKAAKIAEPTTMPHIPRERKNTIRPRMSGQYAQPSRHLSRFRKAEDEPYGRPLLGLAFDPNPSSVSFHHLFRQRQPQAAPRCRMFGLRASLIEALENIG